MALTDEMLTELEASLAAVEKTAPGPWPGRASRASARKSSTVAAQRGAVSNDALR